jgi:hypothetical protein
MNCHPEVLAMPAYASYDAFRYAQLTCPNCGWTGPGREADIGEMFEGRATKYHCPACQKYLAAVAWPRSDERQA